MYNPPRILKPVNMDKDLVLVKHVPPIREDAPPLMARADTVKDTRFLGGGGHVISSIPSEELALDVEEFNIPWNDLVLREKIGAGNLCLLDFSHLNSVSSVVAWLNVSYVLMFFLP